MGGEYGTIAFLPSPQAVHAARRGRTVGLRSLALCRPVDAPAIVLEMRSAACDTPMTQRGMSGRSPSEQVSELADG
jgi:hypothetical protein